MNNTKLLAVEAAQSGIAKKVLSAVPIAEAWTIRQIVSEIARCGSSPDFRIVDGCINSLRDSGLVKEPRHGYFQRVPLKEGKQDMDGVSPPTEKSKADMVRSPAPAQSKLESAEPLDRMARAASTLRSMAAQCSSLAVEVEEAALAAEEKVAKARAENDKLRQLRELLLSIEK